jgi:hypothetical protein
MDNNCECCQFTIEFIHFADVRMSDRWKAEAAYLLLGDMPLP